MTAAPPPDPTLRDCSCKRAHHRHGTRDAYNRDRCRCGACRRANAAQHRSRRRRAAVRRWCGGSEWAEADGTRRRLQALSAAGWSTAALAEHMGVTKTAIAALRSTGQSRVLARTATLVAQLYDRLWWRTPTNRHPLRSGRHAEREGWIPPWRWHGVDLDDPGAEPLALPSQVDEVAVSEAVLGRRVRLGNAERRAVIAELRRRGASAPLIARATGLSVRTIERIPMYASGAA